MIFRFSTLFITANNTNHNTACGDSPTSVEGDDTNLALTIKVGGTQIFATTDLSNWANPVTVAVTGIGNVTAIRFDSTGIKLDIPLANVWDSTTVQVIISKANYYTYNNEFLVFGYDLGNDPNGGPAVTHNPDMDIVMMRDWSNTASQVDNAYSKTIAYRKPFSSKIYCYSLTSFSSSSTNATIQYEYYNGDAEVIATSQNCVLCNIDDQVVYLKTLLGHTVNGEFVLDDACSTGAETITIFDSLKLPYSVQVECGDCTTSCIPVDEDYNAYTLFNNSPSFYEFWIDDVASPPYEEMTLKYQLYDLSGTLITSQEYTIDCSLPFTPDAGNYPFTGIPLEEVGDYVLKTTVSVGSLFGCVTITILHGCTKVRITRNCNSVTLTNITLTDQEVKLYNFTELTAEQLGSGIDIEDYLEDTITVLANTAKIIELEDGFYQFTTEGDTPIIEYIMILCGLETCILSYLKKIVCASKPACGCGGNCGKNCEKVSAMTYNLNAVLTMIMIWTQSINTNWFFSRVFRESQFSDIGALLSDNALSALDVLNVGNYITKAKEYCEECNGLTQGEFKTKGCGCK